MRKRHSSGDIMSSLRKRLNERELTEAELKFFREQRGNIPLCCCEWNFINPVTGFRYPEPLLKCDQMETAVPQSIFKVLCLKCQDEMAKKLGEAGVL